MANTSRRAFLGALTAAGTASVAGCSGLLGGDDDGGLPGYTDWVPASMEEGPDAFATLHVDLNRFQSEFSEEDQQAIDLQSIADRFGQAVEDLDNVVQVQTGLFSRHVILTGSIDPQSAFDAGGSGGEPEEYEQFDVVDGQIAANSDALVASSAYEDVIDAYNGDAERLVEANDEWNEAFRNVGSGTYSVVQRVSQETFEILGLQLDVGSDETVDVTIYTHYSDESTAEEQVDQVESQIQELFNLDLTIDDVRRESNVIVVEATTESLNP